MTIPFVIGLVTMAGQAPAAPAKTPPPVSPCAHALQWGADPSVAAICAGEDADKLAAATRESSERTRQLEAAARHYRRAAAVGSNGDAHKLALRLLAQSFDAQHLKDPGRRAEALADLIRIAPEDLGPVSQLAALQEEQGLLETAEATLLDARRQHPDAAEPYKLLAQFYARRATALHTDEQKKTATTPSSGPGEPDAEGIYTVGGGISPPSRVDVPQYPPEAQAAGVNGAVAAEVVIDATGEVTAAKIVRSIPMLDEAALAAVTNWRYQPTIVNGQAVPVRMTVTVNFTLRK
jgi:TonB family protein